MAVALASHLSQVENNSTVSYPSTKNAAHERICFFLLLPPEVRNMIYVYSLVSSEPIAISPPDKEFDGTSLLIPKNLKASGRTALLRTSKLICREATLVFYNLNIFKFVQALDAAEFLALIGDATTSISRIEIAIISVANATQRDGVKWMFALLAKARRLKKVHCTDLIYEGPESAIGLSRLYSAMQPFLLAMAERHGRTGAGFDIVDIGGARSQIHQPQRLNDLAAIQATLGKRRLPGVYVQEWLEGNHLHALAAGVTYSHVETTEEQKKAE